MLDKLGGFTKSHFSVNCSTWVGNVPEHRPRAKLLVVYSYGLVVFYTITSMQLRQMTPLPLRGSETTTIPVQGELLKLPPLTTAPAEVAT